MVKRDKTVFIIFIVLSFIGIATGINYSEIIGTENIVYAQKCFEFGLLPMLNGGGFLSASLKCVISVAVHSLLFVIGAFSLLTFILCIADTFGLGFKMGVCIGETVGLLRFGGIPECIFMLSVTAVISVFFSHFAVKSFERALYNNHLHKLNTAFVGYFAQSLVSSLILLCILLILIGTAYLIEIKLIGLLSTML